MKSQKGMVLVTGLIFLLITMLATVSTFENAGILAYEQSNNIEKYQSFYHLESQLALLEKSLIENEFHIKDIDQFISSQHIKDISTQLEADFLDDIWQDKNHHLQNKNNTLYLIEYLGSKTVEISEEFTSENLVSICLFRISISTYNEQNYWLQSVLEVYPIESMNLLNESNPISAQRIAWYERVANE